MKLEHPVVIKHAHGGEPRTDRFEDMESMVKAFSEVAVSHRLTRDAHRDAMLMLGHWLNCIDEQIHYHERGRVYRVLGIKPRTAQHAKEQAKKLADPYGRYTQKKTKELQDERAEGVRDGIKPSRQLRKALEVSCETLTTTGQQELAGARDPTGEQGKPLRTKSADFAFCDSKAPASGGAVRPAVVGRIDHASAGAISPTVAPAKPSTKRADAAGASGEQMSFDFDAAAHEKLDILMDWKWQRAHELQTSDKQEVLELLDRAIEVFEKAGNRIKPWSAEQQENFDRLEAGKSKLRN